MEMQIKPKRDQSKLANIMSDVVIVVLAVCLCVIMIAATFYVVKLALGG